MESLHQLLLTRHSIRRYTDQELDPDHVKQILEAALLAPSSKSSRPWQFVVVDQKDIMLRLADSKPVATVPIKNAKMVVVVMADPSKSACWIEDSSIAAFSMQIQAHALGIGSCWVEVLGRQTADGTSSEEFVRSLLGAPDDMRVVSLISFGMPDEVRRPVDPAKLLWEKVHVNGWTPRPEVE